MKQKIDINSLSPQERAALVEKLRKKKLLERGPSYLINPFQVPEKKMEKEKERDTEQEKPQEQEKPEEKPEEKPQEQEKPAEIPKQHENTEAEEIPAEKVRSTTDSAKSPDAVDEILEVEQKKSKKQKKASKSQRRQEREKEIQENEEDEEEDGDVEEIITKSASNLLRPHFSSDLSTTHPHAESPTHSHAHSPMHFPESGFDFSDMNYPLDQLMFLSQRLGGEGQQQFPGFQASSLFGNNPLFQSPQNSHQSPQSQQFKPTFFTKCCETLLSYFSLIKLMLLIITMMFLFPKFFLVESFGIHFLEKTSLLELFLFGEFFMVGIQIMCLYSTHKGLDLSWLNMLSAFNVPYVNEIRAYAQNMVLVYQIFRILASIFSDFLAFSFAHILLTNTEKFFYPIK